MNSSLAGNYVGWTPARIFLLITAVVHIPLGTVGFLYDRSFPLGARATEAAGSAHVFGLFETNGWHTLGALLVGVVAVYGIVDPRRAQEVALSLGVFHIGLFLSLVFWEPSTFLIASNAADQVIHAFTAIAGTVTALRRDAWR